MEFREADRTDILNCIHQCGYIKTQFSFRKKKGRIILQLNDSSNWFSFYKRQDYFMDPDSLEKIDISHFEVNSSGSELKKVNLWNEVLKALSVWLKDISAQH